ncbi:ExeA family protein [Luteimonas sp. MC1825]|uniref:ExeA family protein n=1 Tax=Luteimonas sp. MC1825 TaxID=2761107 RepID=UPI001617A71C|nr:ExeA family protein [Luteimonas sp. MC1825]MBB6598729.1 AAA family ATPase [Luteimonas sp. MC1825]QOC88894.1 AAA family ATPase [Luteimonas sp. MC1825]
MYLAHYGLTEPPFSITPDPRFVFLGERHRDALAHLMFGITQGGGGGFVQLTGEVGTGKTTLSRLLLGQLPDNVRVALVLNPRVNPTQLLETVCEELRIDLNGRRGNAKALIDALNAHLLDAYAQGLRVVLVVDEAQALSVDTLEQVRLLTNLETDTQKLLQVILIGQPELRDMLGRPDLRQLAQRITARFHLTPLDATGTADYLRHRFRIAGGQHFPFDAGAVQRIHLRSGGIPRLVNVIAERALLAGYARDRATLDAALVEEAAREALPPPARATARSRRWMLAAAGMGAAAVLAIALAALLPRAGAPRVGRVADDATRASATVAEAAARAPGGGAASAATGADGASTAAGASANAAATARIHASDADSATLATRIAAAASGRADARAAGGAEATATGSSDERAWLAMLAAWDLPTTLDDARAASACARVLAPGAYCVRGNAHLDRLVAIGRPALLQLEADGRQAWALLQAADGGRARLLLDGRTLDVDRATLQQAWTGRYAAVWRAPVALADAPVQGQQGVAVDWLRARLVTEGVAVQAADGTVFDADLAASVLRFQRARGLAVDGVVGPETLFALAVNDAGPRLARTLD